MGAAQRAVIVGGSVGGLITAHALIKAGWEVTVLEQSPSISPAGAVRGWLFRYSRLTLPSPFPSHLLCAMTRVLRWTSTLLTL